MLRAHLEEQLAQHKRELALRTAALEDLRRQLDKDTDNDSHLAKSASRLEKVRNGSMILARYRIKRTRSKIAGILQEVSEIEAAAGLNESSTAREGHKAREQPASDVCDSASGSTSIPSFGNTDTSASSINVVLDTPKTMRKSPVLEAFPFDASAALHGHRKYDGEVPNADDSPSKVTAAVHSGTGVKSIGHSLGMPPRAIRPRMVTLQEWLEMNPGVESTA